MNRIVFGILFIGLAVISGCQESGRSGVEIVIEGDGQFPKELAGRWKADGKSGWEIAFEKDGSISSVVHTLGKLKLEPGKKTIVPMKMKGESIIEPGPWYVSYSPENREMTVEIVLDYFKCDIGDGYIEGNRRDILTGLVSEDGKSWDVNLLFFMECTGHTEDGQKDLSTNPEYGQVGQFVFNKQSD